MWAWALIGLVLLAGCRDYAPLPNIDPIKVAKSVQTSYIYIGRYHRQANIDFGNRFLGVSYYRLRIQQPRLGRVSIESYYASGNLPTYTAPLSYVPDTISYFKPDINYDTIPFVLSWQAQAGVADSMPGMFIVQAQAPF